MKFLGPVSDADKWALYENALMFVLPSYSENFGNVVAEAMAMGCPVVVTPEVGLAHIVLETGAGIVAQGDPTAFASAIRSLLDDPTRRKDMGERGRAGAIDQLSSESVARRMESSYLRVLKREGVQLHMTTVGV